MSRQTPTSQLHQKLKTLDGKYLLGDEIGKGAYGRVYKGVDLENGDFVAIKQVSLLNIAPEDLASIMQEIDLLKNLNHKNIVKYLGSYKTNSHLYIILEYVENGSLASIIKPNKFGAFPETLVAVYIAQVLEGLVYLHEQGVIHRDIKGANILTTKEGLVKLADFGVATKLSEADNNTDAVVGTPYWMAPEVIVMSGVSAASDIWSMGCTVIELLTCVPPYYELQPMTALFRIVEEEHPPIPEHLSPLITDFLLQCFQKDAKLRPDAKTLLQHPWIQNSRRSSYSSFPRRLKSTTEDLSDITAVPESGEKGDLKVVVEDFTGAKGAHTASAEDDARSHIFGVEMSTTSLAQSNTIGRNTPIRITRELVEKLSSGKDGHVETTPAEEMEVAVTTNMKPLGLTGKPAVNSEGESLAVFQQDGQCLEVRGRLEKPSNVASTNQKGRKLLEISSAGELSRFSDTPADGNLDDLFEEPYNEILNHKDYGALTSDTAMHASSVALAENGRGNLAAKLKAKIAQKRIAVEGAVSVKKDQDDMLSALREDMNAGIADLVSIRTQSVEVTRLIGLLKPEEPEDSVIKACRKLVTIFNDYPDQKQQLISHHGVLPFMDMLELKNNGVLQAVLQVINQLAKNSTNFQENACLVGLVPVFTSFAGPERSKELRMQAAHFVQQLCQSSSSTLQMFIACRGLPVLVGFLEPDYAKYREMVHIAIDCMWQVLSLQGPTLRNDFCRIFAKNGAFIRLVNTLHSLNEATRLASAVGMSQAYASDAVAQQRSSQLELSQGLSGQMKSFQHFPDQHDPSVIRLGSNGHMPSGRGDNHSSVSLKALSTQADVSRVPGKPFPNLFEHVTTDKGWSSSARQEQPLLFRVDGENFDLGLPDSSPMDGDQTRPLLGNADPTLYTSSNQSWHLLDGTRNGDQPVYQSQQEHVQPLISLLEKDPSSRPVSGQLEYIRHLQGGLERHESILPLLHHASAIRKNNGELELLMSAFEDRKANNVGEVAQPSSGFKLSGNSVKQGAQGDGTASTSGTISQPVSGMLSVSGVLNGRPYSATSSGFLSRMVSTLNADVAREYLEKVADLLLEFSNGDSVVKSHMCGVSLLIRLFQILNKLEPPILLKILKCIKRLSKDPCTLEQLQRADAIKHLVLFLEWREGPLVSQTHNQVLKALYNLCKINKKREERAAECGIILHLMHFVRVNSPLKKLALPLLCDMAHASRYTREQLRANEGIELYLDLLDVKDWAVTALDSLAVCLALDNEQRKVEQVILKPEAVRKLVCFFRSCGEQHFVHILEPYLKIITKSPRLNVNLATSGLIPTLVERLDHQDAIARLNLLKSIKAVYEHHPRPKQLIVEYDLQQKLHCLIEERGSGERSGGQVLVKQMATSLLKALHINCVL